MRPSRRFCAAQFRFSLLTTCPYFDNFKFEILMQVFLSAALPRLLPLQLGFECFLYISLSYI